MLRAQGQAEVKLGICRKPADFFAQGSSAEAADDFIDPFIGHSLFLCGKFTGNKFCIGRERKVDLFLFCLGKPVVIGGNVFTHLLKIHLCHNLSRIKRIV